MRLLCWNVQSCRGMDGNADPARTAAEARRLADPDIVCCQEIDSDALIHALPEYQSAWASGVDVPAGRGRYRFGNVILSRFPIGRILRHSLPWPASPDTPSIHVASSRGANSSRSPSREITARARCFATDRT